MSHVHTPEFSEIMDGPDGMPEGVEAKVSANQAMEGQLDQPFRPGATNLEQQHPQFFKANGNYVEHTSFRRGSHGNTFGETRGATALAAAEDMREAAEADQRDMEEAQRIMGEVAEMQGEVEENTDDGAIPEGNPERAEVAELSADYMGAEGEADAALTGIEADTATSLNAALSGVTEDEPSALVQAG